MVFGERKLILLGTLTLAACEQFPELAEFPAVVCDGPATAEEIVATNNAIIAMLEPQGAVYQSFTARSGEQRYGYAYHYGADYFILFGLLNDGFDLQLRRFAGH